MKTITSMGTHWLSVLLKIQLLIILVIIFTACASSGGSATDTEGNSAVQQDASAESSSKASSGGSKVAFVAPEADAQSLQDITKPPRIVEECKKESYVAQEEKARSSIKLGKEATVAGRYGVGFRNAAEHKKWSKMHNYLFTEVSRACADLSKCAKLYKSEKEKTKNCAAQAALYADWKQTTKEFSDKVKSVESTQPPKLCSSPPSPDDLPGCYEKLADKIDKACDSDMCKEAAQCWRSVSFLDIALNQAESACNFARQDLAKCRGYSEASGRRKAKFARCNEIQTQSGVKVVPVL